MSAPLLHFLGHAGFLLEYDGTLLLCDPWLSREGAFLSSWHQYPPNEFINWGRLYESDYLYISHDHADHFDKSFLSSFPDKHRVTVLIADFLGQSFLEEVRALGFRKVVVLRDWEPFPLADQLQVRSIKEPSGFKTDSALLIEAGDVRILDRNDCYLSEADRGRLADLGIDLLLSQFSGAMWYPAAYHYPPDREREIAAGIRESLLDRLVVRAETIRPRHLVHAAGPPCFLEPEFFHLNFRENGIFHDQADVLEELAPRLPCPLHLVVPGDLLTFSEDRDLRIVRPAPFDFSRKRELLEEYAHRRQAVISQYLESLPRPAPGFMRSFKAHLARLIGSSRLLRERSQALARFEVSGAHGGVVVLDTRDGQFSLQDDTGEAPTYEFFLDGPIARLLVEGKESWESVMLSMRFLARRNPDEYNWPLFALLRYGSDPVLIGEIERRLRSDADESLCVRDGGTTYRVQRYCPHAGEDLTHAAVEEGRLTCPRHRWVFDLRAGGACVAGGNVPLAICEPVEDEEQEGEV